MCQRNSRCVKVTCYTPFLSVLRTTLILLLKKQLEVSTCEEVSESRMKISSQPVSAQPIILKIEVDEVCEDMIEVNVH